MKDILVIFSEREAQRLLFSKCSLLRNPFIEEEHPLNLLTNTNWYDFLKSQVETRKWLRIKLWNVLPNVFGKYNDDEKNKKLLHRIIHEIKKPSESPPKLLKTNNSAALRTSFQALLYCHVDMRKNSSHESCIIDSEVAEIVAEKDDTFADEIVQNNEQIWLKDFRWYKDKLEVGKAPKSSVLCMLFCVQGFIRCHWEVAYKVIQTKRNTENFLDEYGTRWVSYSDLIMTMEDEFRYLEKAINNIYDNDKIEKEKPLVDEFIPKYSILRMMCRIWGKWVMKRLLPAFLDKIQEVMKPYHKKLVNIALDYKAIMKTKYGRTSIKNKCSIDQITRDLLLQSVQMIVDISLNEISINFIESTQVNMGNFYPQVEEVVLKEWSDFYSELKEILDPEGFRIVTFIYYENIRTVFPKITQRKLHELTCAKHVEYWEDVIKRHYHDFITSELEEVTKSMDSSASIACFKKILGKHSNERISGWIINLVVESQSGNGTKDSDDSDKNSVSDEDEFKEELNPKNVSLKYTKPIFYSTTRFIQIIAWY